MIEIVKTNAGDIHKSLSRNGEPNTEYIDKAFELKMSLGSFLEMLDPTPEDAPEGSLDAFERQLQLGGIYLKADQKRGLPTPTGALFFDSNVPSNRILFPEYLSRIIRTALIDETDYLSYLVGNWEIADVPLFRAPYLDDTAAKRKRGRRAQGGEVAPTKVSWSEKTVSVNDYAIRLQMTYEFVSQVGLPLLETILKREALQRQLDEASEALYVLINGDVTASAKENGAATEYGANAVYGQTTHASTKDLTYATWLKFILAFFPYKPSVVVANQATLVDWFLMAKPTVDPALIYSLLDKSQTGGVPKLVNVNFGGVNALQHVDMDDDKILALDPRFALWGYRNTGLDMVETDKVITSKFNEIVISNKVGFAKVYATASRVLTAKG